MQDKVSPYVYPGLIERPRLFKLSPYEIIQHVALLRGLSVKQMLKGGKSSINVTAKRDASYLIKKLHPEVSLNQIADMCDYADHTTVLHHIQRVNHLIKTRPGYKENLESMEQKMRWDSKPHTIATHPYDLPVKIKNKNK